MKTSLINVSWSRTREWHRPLAAVTALFLTTGFGSSQEIAVADVTDGAPGVALTDGQADVVDFGRTEPGVPLTRTFSITNTGTENLVLDAGGLSLPAGYSLTSPWPTALMTPTFKVVAEKTNSGVSAKSAAAFSFELLGLPAHLSVKSVQFAIPDELIFATVVWKPGPNRLTPYIDPSKGVRIDNDPLNPLDLDPVGDRGDYMCVPDPVTGEPYNPNGDVCVEFGGASWTLGGGRSKKRGWQNVTLHFRRGAFSGSNNPLEISDVAFGFGIGNIKRPALPRGIRNDGDAYGQIGMEVRVTLWNSETMELIEIPAGVFEDDGIDNGRSEVTFGAGPGELEGEVQVPVAIPPGQTWESVVGSPLTVQLDALEEGVFTGDWSLENSDPDEDPFNFPIIGVVELIPVDDTPPVIGGVPDDIEVLLNGGVCSTEVTWTEPTVTDDIDPSPTLVQTAPIDPVTGEVLLVSGATFPTGFHVIQYTATDAAGNQSTAEFLVQVSDNEPPELIGCVPPRVIVYLPPGQESGPAPFPVLAAFDACDPNAQVVYSVEPGSEFPLGKTEVCAYAEDISGNQSPSQCFDVVVVAGQATATPDNPRSAELVFVTGKDGDTVTDRSGSEVTTRQVNQAVFNAQGSLAVEFLLATGNVGVYKDVGSGMSLVSQRGDTASNGKNILGFRNVTLNDLGQVSFEANAGGAAHFSEGSGALALSLAVGQTAPGTSTPSGSATFGTLGEPAFDGQGAMLSPASLKADLVTATFYDDSGIWRKPANGPLVVLAREGDLIGDAIPNSKYDQVQRRVVANANGDIAFFSNIVLKDDNGDYTKGSTAMLTGQPGSLKKLAQRSDLAPDSDGALFSTFASESINDVGRVAFEAVLQAGTGDPSVRVDTNDAIYTNSNGEVQFVAREGDPIASCGNPDGAVFSSFREVLIAENGDVFFQSSLRGPGVTTSNDGSFWRWRAASRELELIAREGDRAPSTDSVFETLIDLRVGRNGDVAITAYLAIGVGDAVEENDFGVWMDQGDLGVPELVIREGDAVDVGVESLATFTSILLDRTINSFAGAGGHGRVINDAGELIGRAFYRFSEFELNPDWQEGDPPEEQFIEVRSNESGVFILGAP